MTSLYRPVIDKFIEYQHENFYQIAHRLSIYYNSFHLHLIENSNDYFLYFTIFISIITLLIILYVIFESNILLKFFLLICSLNDYLFLKRKNDVVHCKTSLSLLNWLLNTPNCIQESFFNDFLYLINQKYTQKKVNKYFIL